MNCLINSQEMRMRGEAAAADVHIRGRRGSTDTMPRVSLKTLNFFRSQMADAAGHIVESGMNKNDIRPRASCTSPAADG